MTEPLELEELAARLSRVEAELASLRDEVNGGGNDRILSFAETVTRIHQEEKRVRRWWDSRRARSLLLLDVLFYRVRGQLFSTPRRVARWQREIEAADPRSNHRAGVT
jgi:hypothetical protein